jgi:hypothetical protein
LKIECTVEELVELAKQIKLSEPLAKGCFVHFADPGQDIVNAIKQGVNSAVAKIQDQKMHVDICIDGKELSKSIIESIQKPEQKYNWYAQK